VAEAISQRILLLQGEWWESVLDGTPMWQQILGQGINGREQQVALILQNRILGTPYVSGVTNLEFDFNSATRQFQLTASVQTSFGQVNLSFNYPQPAPQGIP